MRLVGLFAERFKSWSFRGQFTLVVSLIVIAAAILGMVLPEESVTSQAAQRTLPPTTRIEPAGTTSTTTTLAGSTTTSVAPSSTTTTATTVPATTTTATTVALTTTTTTIAVTTTTNRPPQSPLAPLVVASATHADSYDRDLFGDWIDADHDCKNTRAEVLISESLAPVTFTSTGCTVATGKWNDPWTNESTTTARDFDVDHTVPLANAWRSGAWAWTSSERRSFANDLSYANHLNAMDAGTNRSKGDDGPEDWKPLDRASWCNYAIAWSEVKDRWGLTVTTLEAAALRSMASTC